MPFPSRSVGTRRTPAPPEVDQEFHFDRAPLALREGPVAMAPLREVVDVDIDFRALRDRRLAVGLDPRVESLPTFQGADRDEVERLTVHAVPDRPEHRFGGRRVYSFRNGPFPPSPPGGPPPPVTATG